MDSYLYKPVTMVFISWILILQTADNVLFQYVIAMTTYVIDKIRILTSDVKFKVCGHWYALVVVYSLTTEREVEF